MRTVIKSSTFFFIFSALITNLFPYFSYATEKDWVSLSEIPPLVHSKYFIEQQNSFPFCKGRICKYEYESSTIAIVIQDNDDVNHSSLNPIWDGNKTLEVTYDKKQSPDSYCAFSVDIVSDLSEYNTISFMIKGYKGDESFDIIFCDDVSNPISLANVIHLGPVGRFIYNQRITTDWQLVDIPCFELSRLHKDKITTMIFEFPLEEAGKIWIQELRFNKKVNFNIGKKTYDCGYLLVDNFDHSDRNLLGAYSKVYKGLPSSCNKELDKTVFYGNSGRSLKLTYEKKKAGFCRYVFVLNQIAEKPLDLSGFEKLSFMVKGEKGGEDFDIDLWSAYPSLSITPNVVKYLKNGVTTQWQEVIIPLSDFGSVNIAEMGAGVIQFFKKGSGTIWIDDIKFIMYKELDKSSVSDL